MADQSELDEHISVVPYDPYWAVLFDQEVKKLHSVLDKRAGQIEHIGSTAVLGMMAKPIIDIMVSIQQQELVDETALAITTLGFEDMGEAGIKGRRHLRKRSPSTANVHIVLANSDLWNNNLLLRDYLRAHPDEAKRYSDHKREIVKSGANALLAYSDQKAKFIQDLMRRAQIWKGD